jgi:outer membrane protein, heavy metal efflux system
MKRVSGKWGVASALLLMLAGAVQAEEIARSDLPLLPQVMQALDAHLLVLNAHSNLKLEQAQQRRWDSGNYEFNLRAGSAQRQVVSAGQKLREWDVALERGLRLPNKVFIDSDIGTASVARADFALGDAHHEAGRSLLRLWFASQKERVQVSLWQQQVELLTQQAEVVSKRVKAGDAPNMEANLAHAATAQARLALQQAELRAQLAMNDVQREFPAISVPNGALLNAPQAITHDAAYWQAHILDDNHELGMAKAHAEVQQLLAQRSRADQVPDPTVGLRYSNEMGGNEKVAGVYLTVPISFGQRNASAQMVAQQAQIAADQAAFVERRLSHDVDAAYQQAVRSYATYLQAREAGEAIRSNAELIAKAYRLGEGSLADSLSARRIAQEATLSENLAQLNANESRYRLELDAHQLWSREEANHEPQ